jgi:endonuclease/exonuclease/phosphatase family metal-dependent hydrolase
MKWDATKKVFIVLCGLLCGLAGLFVWASGGIQAPQTIEGLVYDFGAGPSSKAQGTSKIVLLTWNIAYAYGFGSDGQDYVPRTAADMANRLNRIGEIIRVSGADIVLLQEIDFDSHRSHHIDQLEELSHITGLRYGARAVTWKAGYVPFPYWPPEYNFGAMCSGGAVLSHYPVAINRVTLYPKPEANAWWYNAFYPFRYSQQVQIQWGEQVVWVINNHLEAYDQENRIQQANTLARMIHETNIFIGVVIVGGDMNTIPPEAAMRHSYPDRPNADHRGDTTMNVLRNISGFKEVVKAEDYLVNESAFFTAPAHAPNRRLDYLFVSENTLVTDVRIIPTGDLSDHLPVRAELIWQ